MLDLIFRVHQFKQLKFERRREFYEQLSRGQNPKNYIITCVDSRIDLKSITQFKPGDMLVSRNPGNLIPPYVVDSDIAATIDLAMTHLDLENIILMGHSGCGAMSALRNPAPNTPKLNAWLKHAEPALQQTDAQHPEIDKQSGQYLELLIQENIRQQIKNLEQYPKIKENRDKIAIHGWYFEIGTGNVFVCDKNGTFHPFEEALPELLALQSTKKSLYNLVELITLDYLAKTYSLRNKNSDRELQKIVNQLEQDGITPIWDTIQSELYKKLSTYFGAFTQRIVPFLEENMAEINFKTLNEFKKKRLNPSFNKPSNCPQILAQPEIDSKNKEPIPVQDQLRSRL